MRNHNESYLCIVCGEIESGSIVCRSCEIEEKQKQKNAPGSLTSKQNGYINVLLYKSNTEYNGDISKLTSREAGQLINNLLNWIENDGEKPENVRDYQKEKCDECGGEVEKRGYTLCAKCYDTAFYNGVPRVQCSATKKDGDRCGNFGHFIDGYCGIHSQKKNETIVPTLP